MIHDEEVRKKVERVHRGELALAQRAYELGRQFLGDAYDDSEETPERLAWLFVARGLAALRSSVNLFCLGDETDALAVCRTLIELGIDFEYIWLKETAARVQRYFDFGLIAEERLEEAMKNVYGAGAVDADQRQRFEPLMLADPAREFASFDDYVAARNVDRARVRPLFKKKTSWIDVPLSQRAEQGGNKEHAYDILYFLGCEATHSNVGGMSRFATPVDSTSTAPQHPMVLGLATRCFSAILNKASEVTNVGVDGLDALARDADAAMKST